MPPKSRKKNATPLNIMVTGFSGVGKTAFVRTFCETLTEQDADPIPDLTGPLSRTEKPYPVSLDFDYEGERIALTVIDTPGFQVNTPIEKSLQEITEYIEQQFDLAIGEELKVKRNPKAVDTRVHACLYFLDANDRSLGANDLAILKRLSTRVNVIPVISKGDTLTIAQKAVIQPTIMHEIFDRYKIPIFGYPDLDEEEEFEVLDSVQEEDEEEEEQEEADTEDQNLPNGQEENFQNAVDQQSSLYDEICNETDVDTLDEETRGLVEYLRKSPYVLISYEEDPSTGRPIVIKGDPYRQQQMDEEQMAMSPQPGSLKTNIIGRQYPWTTLDCLNPQFSDFSILKTLLLSTHRKLLITETIERFYEGYRTERLLLRKANKTMSVVMGKKILEELHHI
ncbi:Septin-domain-containing protein [Umbelopsis sp. AD052]|nr:Septin-domain-containing protein [Umbelopsis sp. AD052]